MKDSVKKGIGSLVSFISENVDDVKQKSIEKKKHRLEQKKEVEEEKKEREKGILTKSDGSVEIVSVKGMQSFLSDCQSAVSPAIQQAIQTQMQVLSFVQSPTLSGMAVDNMLFCLDKSVKLAVDENERTLLRDQFCSMIQTFIFFNEARILQIEKSTRQQGVQLLSQAGGMLAKNVVNIAMMAATAGTSKAVSSAIDAAQKASGAVKDFTQKETRPRISVDNIFDDPDELSEFAKQAISWASNKKMVEMKKLEFDQLLDDMFLSFDQYFPLIGPSILINGLLSRYKNRLVDRFEKENANDRKAKRKEVSMASASAILDLFEVNNKLVEQLKRSSAISVDQLFSLKAIAYSEYAESVYTLESYKKDIDDLESQMASLSFLSPKKRSISEKLDNAKESYEMAKNRIRKTEARKIRLDELISQYDPVGLKIDEYEKRLSAIADKYAVRYSDYR